MTAFDDVDVEVVTEVARRDDGRVDLHALFDAVQPAILLETATGDGWSYVVPIDSRRLVDDGTTSVFIDLDGPQSLGSDPFDALDVVCARFGLDPHARPDPALPPFTGGVVGALAYDLARRVERLDRRARRDRDHADLVMWLAEQVVAIDPSGTICLVVQRRFGRAERAAPSRSDRSALTRRLRATRTGGTTTSGRPGMPGPRPAVTSLSRPAYLSAVDEILAHIAAGDVFQVNLTQRLSTRWGHDVSALYRALIARSPAPFGACLPALGIASISPETFLGVERGQVTTRPIKGTRPRDPDPSLDAALADDLITSPKDRAENLMVVDMERNDLGRVCVPGSVHVPALFEVEAHPTVWHLVSSVTGSLAPEVGYGTLLRATFPCGSITGTPKVAAMGLIEALEPVTRGWYCGALGYLSVGAASMSVAIRTATLQADGVVDYGAGGGIVAESDPTAEHDESLAKAAAFLQATNAHVDGGTR